MDQDPVVLHLTAGQAKTLRLALISFMQAMREIDTGRDDWPLDQLRRANNMYEAVIGGGN